ncbi:hypothetical protein LINPERHAP1_LOCUS34873 [Linum perenne]
MVGHVKASLDFTVSFFSTAKSLVNFPPKSLLFSLISNLVLPKYVIFMDGSRMSEEEIEVEAKVIGEKGRLASVVIEVRRRSNGELIALGKQWMASHSNHVHATSKL